MIALKLTEPVTVGSERVTEIKFRKPKTKDLRTLGSSMSMNDLLTFAQHLSDQSPFVFDEMCIEDGQAAMEIAANFFQRSQAIGTKP